MAPIREFKPKVERKERIENGGSWSRDTNEFVSLAFVDVEFGQAKQRKERNDERYKR